MNLINAVQSGRKGSYIDRNIKMLARVVTL